MPTFGFSMVGFLLLFTLHLIKEKGEITMENFFGVLLLICFIGFLPALYLYVYIINPMMIGKKIVNRANELIANRFEAQYILNQNSKHSHVLFNVNERKIAFVHHDSSYIYNYDDIITYNWEWLEKNGTKYNHCFTFQVRDIDNPVRRVPLSLGTAYATQWNAKIPLIMGWS